MDTAAQDIGLKRRLENLTKRLTCEGAIKMQSRDEETLFEAAALCTYFQSLTAPLTTKEIIDFGVTILPSLNANHMKNEELGHLAHNSAAAMRLIFMNRFNAISADAAKRTIRGVAIKRPSGEIIQLAEPARHDNIIEMIRARGSEPTIDDQFGFYTDNNPFLTREEAGELLGANRPIYSEDLW